MIIVAAVAAVLVGIVSRLFIRIPPGSVGLVVKAGHHDHVLTDGIHRVSPVLALTHVVTTREIAFDVPVSEVRSSDGVGVNVDALLTLRIADPVKFAYSITTGDLDQLLHGATQDALRTMIRGVPALTTLDLGSAEADVLRATIDAKLEPYGVDVRARRVHQGQRAGAADRVPRGPAAVRHPARRAGTGRSSSSSAACRTRRAWSPRRPRRAGPRSSSRRRRRPFASRSSRSA